MKFQRYLNLFSTAIFMSSFALVSNAHDNEHALEQEHMQNLLLLTPLPVLKNQQRQETMLY